MLKLSCSEVVTDDGDTDDAAGKSSDEVAEYFWESVDGVHCKP